MTLIFKISPLIITILSSLIYLKSLDRGYVYFIGNGLFFAIFVMILTLVPSIIRYNKIKKNIPTKDQDTLDNNHTHTSKSFYLIWSKQILFVGLLFCLILFYLVHYK